MHRFYIIFSCLYLLIGWGFAAAQQQNPPPNNGSSSLSDPSGAAAAQGSRQGLSPGTSVNESGVSLPDYFYKHLTGTIGGSYHIVVNLTRMGSKIVGDYYYRNQGIPLFFGYGSTITKNGTVHLVEMNDLQTNGSGNVTGVFDGRFVGKNELRGTWKKSGSSKTLPFAVTTVGLTGGPFDVEHLERAYYDHSHGSAKIDVTYPVLRTTSSETDAAFNSNVLTTVVGLYENGVNSVQPTSVAQAMHDFIHTFVSQLDQPSSRTYFPPWSYSISARVLFNADGILSLRYEDFSFEGGAHPNTVYQNASYVRTTGSVVTLDDILKPGSREKLNAIGLAAFRHDHGIAPGESLQQAGYFVDASTFKLNTNFMVTKAGLLFQFNQYEIAPYYFGAQQVLIPYGDLKGILVPNSPIADVVAAAATGPAPQ